MALFDVLAAVNSYHYGFISRRWSGKLQQETAFKGGTLDYKPEELCFPQGNVKYFLLRPCLQRRSTTHKHSLCCVTAVLRITPHWHLQAAGARGAWKASLPAQEGDSPCQHRLNCWDAQECFAPPHIPPSWAAADQVLEKMQPRLEMSAIYSSMDFFKNKKMTWTSLKQTALLKGLNCQQKVFTSMSLLELQSSKWSISHILSKITSASNLKFHTSGVLNQSKQNGFIF